MHSKLASTVTEQMLREHFFAYGEITEVVRPPSSLTSDHGFCVTDSALHRSSSRTTKANLRAATDSSLTRSKRKRRLRLKPWTAHSKAPIVPDDAKWLVSFDHEELKADLRFSLVQFRGVYY